MGKLIKNRDFWLVIFVLALGFYSGFFKDLFWPPQTAYLEINFGETRRAFEGELPPYGMSVLDALNASAVAGNFEVGFVLLDDRTDIFKIDGVAETGLEGKSWNFYLNGRKIDTAEIHKTKIKAGDKIIVKFE